MTTYYVSSQIGNNTNAGTSAAAPLASLQAAANIVKPGDTVQVMNGTYTAPAYGAALDITTSGTAIAPITFEAAPGQKPVIDSSGGWNAIDIQASYIVVSGFTVVGGAANYNLQSALAGYSTGNASLDGNGIVVNPSSSVSLPNHITIENNTVSNEPGGGIATDGADYVQILNNVVHNNANWSAYGTSGITMNSSVNLDTNAGPHDIVSGNIVYDNAQLVPSSGVGAITDGEGIILDSNQNYTSEILVENNTVYGNGSAGIESFLTNNATITGNNIYGNNTQNIQSQNNAEILINQSNNNTVTNNTTVNPNVPAPVISNAVANSNGTVTLTGTAVGGSSVAVWDGGQSAVGTATASSTGAWTFTTPDLLPGAYGFTAIDQTAAGGTSAPSNSFAVTLSSNPSVAPPVISKIVANSDDSVTLTGTAAGGSIVTVWSTTGDNDGSTTASNTGAWSFTTPDLLAGIYGYTTTDTTAAGTSLQSNALGVTVPAAGAPTAPLPGAPIITKGTVNSNDSVTLTGTAPNGATVTVSDGGASPLGTTTASSAGAWSFTTPDLSAGAYAFTANDTTAAGTSVNASPLGVTVAVAVALPPAPVITKDVVNSNDSVTLTGTALANSTVTVWTTTGSNYGTTTASSAGAWSFTTPDLSAGAYAFTANDTTAAGTSVNASPLGVTVAVAVALPPAPVITKDVVNSNDSVTLTGTALANSTVTVWTTTGSNYGTTTANSTGAWSFTTPDLSAGAYAFTANDTTAAGTSVNASPLGVTVAVAAALPPAPVITKDVVNSNDSVTLTGTALANSTVTVWTTTGSNYGTTTANSTGAWSFTTPDLSAGAYAFTANDTTAAGTSVNASPLGVTVAVAAALPPAPVITKDVVNSNDSVTLTGTALANSTVTVWTTTGSNYGTTTANSTGAWSFTTPDMSAGAYAFTANDTTAAGTSANASPLGVTVAAAAAALPAAPVISKIAVNSNDSLTLTGTALANSTVTVWSTTGTNDGTTTANSTGAWSFTTPVLLPSVYGYMATDTTAAGTSTKSNALGVTMSAATQTVVSNALEAAPAAALPAAPSLTNIAVNSNDSVTLKGTAVAGSTVTVWSTTGTNDGTTTASTFGAWSFTTPDLLPSIYGYAATDTTSAGTSVKSNALGVTVPAQSFSANGNQYGEEINLSATSDELDLTASGLTITRGSGTESVKAGSSVFPFSSSDYRSTETIDAQLGEHFVFNPQFGHETIQGFNALGSDADTLQLSISSFSYLNAGMSQSADLAALLMHSTSGTSSTTITDSSGDTLTLAGLFHSTIAADAAAKPSFFKFT